MGKIKTVQMGDEQAEEKAREKAAAKREQKKKEKAENKKAQVKVATKEPQIESTSPEKSEEPISPESPKRKPAAKKTASADRYHFTRGKKYAAAKSLVDPNKIYSLKEALDLVKKTSYSKFDGTVELHLNVTDKGLRDTLSLPHGTGKQTRIKVADDGLIANLEKGGKIDFDLLVSSPDMMPKLARIAKILGPRGLMPNPKTATISDNPAELAKTLSASLQWKTEPNFPIIHTTIGKVSFEPKRLEENFQAIIKSIGKDKIKSAFLKASMGPAIKLQA